MATADIAKEAVFDGRIVQYPARYAVDKGGLSLTNSPYPAIGATNSQHTYNINVPSQNVFVDRAIEWQSGVRMFFNCTVGAAGPGNLTTPVLQFGREAALCAFPLHSLVNTATATINDTSVTINTDTVLREVLRLVDYRKHRLSRVCPTALDTYLSNVDAAFGVNSPAADYASQTAPDQRPNGAWYDVQWIDPNNGQILSGGTAAAPSSYVYNGIRVGYVSGVPIQSTDANPVAQPAPQNRVYPLAIQFRSTEKLVLPPFIFADAAEWETGLFGINNIQIVFTLKSDLSRIIRPYIAARNPGVSGKDLTDFSLSAGWSTAFVDPRINVQYLTPSLDLPLPAKSVVPYMEFPRYLTSKNDAIPARGSLSGVTSQTIVLPQIPDMLMIYAKPQTYGQLEGDFYLPITQISVNFDNFAGLLSSHTREQLYEMSVHNGLQMDYDQWSGLARSGNVGTIADGLVQPYNVATVGGFLILKPGQDITLQSGQAPGLIGNFTLQFNCTVFNPRQTAVNSWTLYVIAVNTGFFETLAGSSRIVKGVLSEADIISAEPAPEGSGESMARLVGHGFMDRIGSFLSKAKSAYAATKPVLSAVKEALPAEGKMGKVKGAMGAVGYGGPAGGAGPAGGGKKSLSARLM